MSALRIRVMGLSLIVSVMLCTFVFGPASLAHGGARANANPDWVVESTISSQGSIADIAFIDASNGWAVGNAGGLYVTHDGGQSWQAQDSGTTDDLYRIIFADGQNGYAVGNRSLLHTADSGKTWQLIQLPAGWRAVDVAVPKVGTILVAGANYGGNFTIGLSTDGGTTWQHVE